MIGIGEGLIRLVLRGLMGPGQSWSCSLWLATGDGSANATQAQLDAVVLAAESLAGDWTNTVKGFNSAQWSYTGCDGYYYLPNTRHAALQSSVDHNAPVTGTGQPLPIFTSFVASLRTGVPGRSGRGRIYIPATGAQLNSQSQLTQAQCNSLATATATLIHSINTIPIPFDSLAGACVVASFTKNVGYAIKSVVVNSQPDVQHRRTDKLGHMFQGTVAV